MESNSSELLTVFSFCVWNSRHQIMRFYNKIAFWIVSVWAVIEITLCIVFLYMYEEKNSHTYNFMYKLCNTDTCNNFILKAIIGRIITIILLFVGNLMVIRIINKKNYTKILILNYILLQGWTLLMAPWFLINAIGIFPLLPVIVSSCYKCKYLK